MPVRHLTDLPNRNPSPRPWEEIKATLPWDDPAFSRRMLAEHLDPSHDAASRRPSVHAAQLSWVVNTWLLPRGAKTILDLTCGPGLWANDLARRGYTVKGIDISPAAIAHARETAGEEKLSAAFIQQDIREAAFGSGFDCALFIYGEPNTCKWEEFSMLLIRIRESLNIKGVLILELSTQSSMAGRAGTSWDTRQDGGLFGERPYVLLTEYFYNPDEKTGCRRYYVVDIATSHVREYGVSYQCYTFDDLLMLMATCGYKIIGRYDSLTGDKDLDNPAWLVIVAEKDDGERK